MSVSRMSSEISQLCLEALSPLAEQCAKNQEKDSALFVATRHFLKVRSLYVMCSELGRPETVRRRHSEGRGDVALSETLQLKPLMLLPISSRSVRLVGVRHAGPAETQHGDDGSGGRSFLHARVSAPGESMTSCLRVSWRRARVPAGPPGGLMCRTCRERAAFQLEANWQRVWRRKKALHALRWRLVV